MRTDVPILQPVVEKVAPNLAQECADDGSEVAEGEFVGGEQPRRREDNFRPGGDDANDPAYQHHHVDNCDEEDLGPNLNG